MKAYIFKYHLGGTSLHASKIIHFMLWLYYIVCDNEAEEVEH